MKYNIYHLILHRRFWGSACLLLSDFLLPVSFTATSAADDESIFVSSDADAPSPDSYDTASDKDGFFSGDSTNDSARDNTIHVIIENENSSSESNPGETYTVPDTAGYAGGAALRAHPQARLFSISHSFSLKTAIFPASP